MFVDIAPTLTQLNFAAYLTPPSIQALSKTSSHSLGIVYAHVCKTFTLKLHKDYIEELNVYTDAQRIGVEEDDTYFYSEQERVGEKLPHTTTHLIYSNIYKTNTQKRNKYVYRQLALCAQLRALTHLSFGTDFNMKVDELPGTITHIKFGRWFNQNVDNLPAKLTHLSFGENFNHKVDHLPARLAHLEFGDKFNQPTNNLPQKLIFLKYGTNFNQTLKNLPPTLHTLIFGKNFNKPVDHLPVRLARLEFGDYFNYALDKLPLSLTHLTVGKNFTHKLTHLPSSVLHLTVSFTINLPEESIPLNMVKIPQHKNGHTKPTPHRYMVKSLQL